MPEFGFASSVGGDDELGIWQALPVATPRDLGLHGGELADVSHEISVWQVALTADRRAAGETLAAARLRLIAADSALPFAAQRLNTFSRAGVPAPELPPGRTTPERDLYEWITASEEGRDLPDEAGRLAEVLSFFDKVQDTLRNYAAIDTGVGGARVGVTLVSWTGDFQTVWARGLAVDDAQQHTAAVALALRTRDTWLRLGMTVAAGAVQLTTLSALNPALALPAAYRFVRQIIQQVQALGGLPAPA